MADMMAFPNTVEEFMEQYKIVDTEKIYTNGTELVPIFRMMQWFEHVSATDTISRQTAIDLAKDLIIPSESFHQYNQGVNNYCAELVKLQPAQPSYNPDEWCHDCKEYDQERHSCPRWNRVIRKTVDELRAEQAERREG